MTEEWRNIPLYEGFYEISNFGNVRNFKTKQVLKIQHNKGYCCIKLHKNKKIKTFSVHRLVAMAFLDNTNNLYSINHKNENKNDNTVDNLEWCTVQYNNAYSKNKKVIQYDLSNNIIKEWESIKLASESTNIKKCNITLCCQGKRKSAGNYIWKYK